MALQAEQKETTEVNVKPMGLVGALKDESINGPQGTPAAEVDAAGGEGIAADAEGAAALAASKEAAAQGEADKGKEGEPKTPQVQGVLRGIQVERQKRQAAEQRTKDLEAQIAQLTGGAPVEGVQSTTPATDPQVDRKLLLISEQTARAAHPDYDEKFKAFEAAATQNPELFDVVMSSDSPGEAAYQAGRNIMFQKKYGSDPDGVVKAVREETEKEMRDRIRKEVEAEVAGKVQAKNNQPKNILASRAAGSGEGETVPVIGFTQLLAKRRKG